MSVLFHLQRSERAIDKSLLTHFSLIKNVLSFEIIAKVDYLKYGYSTYSTPHFQYILCEKYMLSSNAFPFLF